MNYFILFIGLSVRIYANNDIKCPSARQWRLRAQSYCHNEESYTCLFYIDAVVQQYTETCNGPRKEVPGEKTVINSGNFDTVDCSDERYQPILFSTTESSNCLLLKSNCSEKGQVIYSNGSTTEDRTCGCNYAQQYAFLSQHLTNPCYCRPSVEDCTCYQKPCHGGFRLSPDYECVQENVAGGNYNCKEIIPSEHKIEDEVVKRTESEMEEEKIKGRSKDPAKIYTVSLLVFGILLMVFFWKKLQIYHILYTTKVCENTCGVNAKERENHQKILILLVEHAREGFAELIDLNVSLAGYGTFKHFINAQQHEIYHMCYSRFRCCQCDPGYILPKSVLNPQLLEILLDKNGPKKKCHNPERSDKFCCCYAHPGLTTHVPDVTFARCILENWCQDVLWYSCLTLESRTLEDFLTHYKHDIYHLYDLNKCCQCPSGYVFPTKCTLITREQWIQLFSNLCLPCSQDRSRPGLQSICSSFVTAEITISDLGANLSQILLDHFCQLKQEIDNLINYRFSIYGHMKHISMPNTQFKEYKDKIVPSLLLIARVSNKEKYYKQKLKDLDIKY